MAEKIINNIKLPNGEVCKIGGASGFKPFDPSLKDHILTYEETKGWALQGTYVYKDAVAGSRYGYPDFYNKCVEEFENSSNSQTYLKSNVTKVGSLVDNQGALSGFSTSDYATLPSVLPSVSNWEYGLKVKFSAVNTTQYFFNTNASGVYSFLLGLNTGGVFSVHASSNGSSWNIASDIAGRLAVQTNTYYYVKFGFNGTEYYVDYSLTGEVDSYVRDITIATTALIPQPNAPANIGKGWSTGEAPNMTVDLSYSYLDVNGQRFWSGTDTITKNPNGHLFYDIADKSRIDELYNTNGMAWYYGIDKENERIFLPRTKHFAFTGGVMGNGITLGLTNGTINGGLTLTGQGTAYIAENNYGVNVSSSTSWTGVNYGGYTGITTDPTKSGITLETDDSKYLYICVGNTNVESAVTDVVDVTTTENDTTPLFTGMYFDFTPNNVSWLKAGEQVNSGGIYTFTYNELVNILGGETKYSDLKVINVADMVAGEDYSLYWKVNQDDMTFITPIRTNERVLVEKKEPTDDDPTWYNLYSDGWCEQGGIIGSTGGLQTVTMLKPYNSSNYNVFGNYFRTGDADVSSYNYTFNVKEKQNTSFVFAGVFTNDVGKGITGADNELWSWEANGYVAIPTNNNLYFKVANAVQNLELLDAGEVLEALSDKVDRDEITECIAVVETYHNGTSWYRVYSDGWCEQGGYAPMNVTSITFLKPFVDTNYTLTGSIDQNTNAAPYWTDFGFNRTATGFSLRMGLFSWQASGYIS